VRLLLSIPSLARGGAEGQFAALAAGLAARGHQVTAVTLGQGGPLARELGGARLVALGKTSRLDNPRVALALASLLRRERPAVHYAFLPSCCVLGGLLTPFFPQTCLVMGVRASALASPSAASRLLLALEARLARRAALVIANSQTGLRHCQARGYAPAATAVVPNGVDTGRFRPDRAQGEALRREWNASAGGPPMGPLVGLVARLDPMKDHATFLAAAARIAAHRPGARFVCVGAGPEAYARSLREMAERLGLAERLVWAGERADMPAVYNALDVLCLASAYGEGFPNVLAEALACGVPCVATNVGDAALALGETGMVTPPCDAQALAEALAAMLDRAHGEGAVLADACRERAAREFSVAAMVAGTEALLRGL